MAAADIPTRDQYRYFVDITTRWQDNDVYGHVNNVVYYSYFDTAANHLLIHEGGLDILAADIIGVVAESQCRYFSGVAYPDVLEAGVRIEHLGNRSVRYGIAIFRQGEQAASAAGHFVHVFVERATMRPAGIPEPIRSALARHAV
ncbi:MAG: acyl-CoA thioesterase [Pseudomonadota bacterium]